MRSFRVQGSRRRRYLSPVSLRRRLPPGFQNGTNFRSPRVIQPRTRVRPGCQMISRRTHRYLLSVSCPPRLANQIEGSERVCRTTIPRTIFRASGSKSSAGIKVNNKLFARSRGQGKFRVPCHVRPRAARRRISLLHCNLLYLSKLRCSTMVRAKREMRRDTRDTRGYHMKILDKPCDVKSLL
ncbi:hypothetical protein PUN28_016354 [Cardiocondyla obscurior]|uniref:Uncharacterized protein n=1 Tax=Cardiocondyla obscurior TaxID=286306 RepID=A0AAW2EW27_9HYME